jgi:hypothetical protein
MVGNRHVQQVLGLKEYWGKVRHVWIWNYVHLFLLNKSSNRKDDPSVLTTAKGIYWCIPMSQQRKYREYLLQHECGAQLLS